MKVGDVFRTNNCGKIEILARLKGQVCEVRFLDTGTVIQTRCNAIAAGSVKDPFKHTVCGVGYIGQGGVGAKKDRQAYRRWHAMLNRCYNEGSDRYSYYGARGMRVAKEWHNFQNYKEWFRENFRDGLQVDKDFLGGDSPVYSKDTCVCITPRMNQFSRSPVAYKGMQEIATVGAGQFCVTVRDLEGYSRYIGLFDNPNEALLAYSDVKHSYFVDLLESDWKAGMISEYTYKKLQSVTPVLFYEKATIA